jgi:hypothetical protein
MVEWTKQNGTKTYLVNSTSAEKAQEALDKRLASIKQSLHMIETELQKYESLRCPDWAHVGSLGHVDVELISVFEFISESDN